MAEVAECNPIVFPVLARLQIDVGPEAVRECENAPRPLRPHLEARHRPVQQVRFRFIDKSTNHEKRGVFAAGERVLF